MRSITRGRSYNRHGERTDLKPSITFKDDYAVNLRTGEEITPMRHSMDIKNDVQRNATAMRLAGATNEQISRVVADIVDERGFAGSGRYSCSCNNWGPRWIENSKDAICQGCWNWARDHHQEMKINGVKPVTMDMIERSTWGFNVAKIKELKAKNLHNWCHAAAEAVDFKGLPWVLDGEVQFTTDDPTM